MNGKIAGLMVRSLIAGAVTLCISTGCRGFSGGIIGSRGPSIVPPRAAFEPEEGVATRPTRTGESEAMLAAVEEFLEWTENYQLASQSSGGEVSHAHPDGHATADSQDSGHHAADVNRGPGHAARPQDSIPVPSFTTGVVANGQVSIAEKIFEQPTLAIPTLRALRVRPVVDSAADNNESEKVNATNEPLDMDVKEAARKEDLFVEQLKRKAEQSEDFDSQWRLNLALFALDRLTVPHEPLGNLTAEAHRILGGVMRLAALARRAARNPMVTEPEVLDAVDEFRTALAERAEPEIARIALCSKVSTFGVYEQMKDTEFVAGRTVNTIVYSEIENLHSEMTPDERHRTLLSTRLEILSVDGDPVWNHEEPRIEDLCSRHRRDFFVAQRVELPPTIPVGEYVLKVFVEDQVSGMVTESSYPLTMYSPLSVATR